MFIDDQHLLRTKTPVALNPVPFHENLENQDLSRLSRFIGDLIGAGRHVAASAILSSIAIKPFKIMWKTQEKNQTQYLRRGLDILYPLPIRGGVKGDMLLPICPNDKAVVIYEVRNRQADTFLELYAHIIYRKKQLCGKISSSSVKAKKTSYNQPKMIPQQTNYPTIRLRGGNFTQQLEGNP